MGVVLAFLDTRLGKYVLMAAVAIAAAVAFGVHERNLGYQHAMEQVAKERKAEEAAYLRMLAARAAAFNALNAKFGALRDQRDREFKDGQTKLAAAVAELKEKRSAYVSTLSTRACPDLPAGYLLHRRNAADIANGKPASAPEPSPELAAASTGVSLPAIARTDEDQAFAYRGCQQLVAGWQTYYLDVQAWKLEVDKILGAP